MKKLLWLLPVLFVVCCLKVASAPATRTALWSLHVTNGSTTVPTNLVASLLPAQTNIYVRRLTLYGGASPQLTNTSVVWIGNLSGNGTQSYPVYPGSEVVLRVPDDSTINLKDIWFDVTTVNDGLTVFYLP